MILDKIAPLLAKGANPLDRWDAARIPINEAGGITWAWAIAVVAGLAALVTALWWALRWIDNRRERRLREFEEQSDRFGLSPEERNLLRNIAARAGVKAADRIFSSAMAFDRGMSTVETNAARTASPARSPARICGSCSHVLSLREKLGFDLPPDPARTTSVVTGKIRPGTMLRVLRQSSPEDFNAVSRESADTGELLIEPELAVEPHPGESWTLRYAEGGILWEFSAWVVRNLQGAVALRPSGAMRWINRRRFVRTAIHRPAHVARFPFHRNGLHAARPQFVTAELTEIAGPGLKLRAPLEVSEGEKLLVVAELRPGEAIEGVAVVRHADAPGAGECAFAVELMGLTTSELADLTRETNIAGVSGDPADRSGTEVAKSSRERDLEPRYAPVPAGAG